MTLEEQLSRSRDHVFSLLAQIASFRQRARDAEARATQWADICSMQSALLISFSEENAMLKEQLNKQEAA